MIFSLLMHVSFSGCHVGWNLIEWVMRKGPRPQDEAAFGKHFVKGFEEGSLT